MEKDINYFELINDVMQEKRVKILDLEENKVLKKDIFYKYKKRSPSMKNAISMANFLEVSWDYILGNTSVNNFKRYKEKQTNFYTKFTNVVNSMGISKNKLLDDLGFSSSNLSEWKNGTTPQFYMIVEISKHLPCNIDDLLETE